MKEKKKEEWKKLIILMDEYDCELQSGYKEHPWYSISNHGNLVSHINQVSLGNRGFATVYEPSARNPVKFSIKKRKENGSIVACYKKLSFPNDFFDDKKFKYASCGNLTVKKTVYAHQLVKWAFEPIDTHPPERLKDCWDFVPEPAKQVIRQSMVVHHDDHNPLNNYIENLFWVTPKENSHEAVKFYGGNVVNKNKIIKPVKLKNTLQSFYSS